jgi:hypothetical protein
MNSRAGSPKNHPMPRRNFPQKHWSEICEKLHNYLHQGDVRVAGNALQAPSNRSHRVSKEKANGIPKWLKSDSIPSKDIPRRHGKLRVFHS